MRHARLLAVAVVACLAAANPRPGSGSAGPVLRRIADVPLPGPAVRFDYQSLDTAANRLYISHMNAGELVAFDVASRKVAGVVTELPRTTGNWCVPSLGKVYASVTARHQVAVIDAATLRVVRRVGNIGFPDGIAFAPGVKKIYVSDESGGGELVIDGVADSVVTTIELGGEAGNTIYDPGSGHVLVAVQTLGEFVEIDPHTDRVVARHPLAGAAHPHGMSLDTGRRLLFVANEGNATVQTVDLRSMNVVDQQAVGEDPDVLAFDPAWRRLYVAAESGVVSVFTETKGRLVLDGRIEIPHAHTVSVDPRTHLVYFPLQDVAGHPLLRIMAARHP